MPVCSGDRRPARTSPEDIARKSELLEKSRDLLLIPYDIEGCSPVTRMGMRWAGDGRGMGMAAWHYDDPSLRF